MSEEHPTMREEEEVELLSRVDLFESLSKEEIRVLVRQNSDVRLGEGETFYAPWEHDGKLFILKKGRMRLYRTEGAREFTLEVVDAGTVFGEMAFTPHRLRESYARAIVPSVVFVIERAEVERLIEEKPQVGIKMISLLSERLHFYETRMEDVTLREVPARLASLILFLIESEGGACPRGDQHTHPLHPRAPWHHDRGEQGGSDKGFREASGRGGSADQATPHLRR